MLKEQAKTLARVTKLVDSLTVFGSFALAYLLRSRLGGLDHLHDYLWLMLVILPVWHYLMCHYKLYSSIRTLSPVSILLALAKVHLIGSVVASSVIYLVEPRGYSRALFLLFIFTSMTLLSVSKLSLNRLLEYIRRRGFNFRTILIVGSGTRAQDFVRIIGEHSGWGLKVAGLVRVDDEAVPEWAVSYPLLGNLDQLLEICRRQQLDEVVFCLPRNSGVIVDSHIRDLEELGITVRLVLDLYDVHTSRRELSFFHEFIPMLTFYSRAFDGTQLLLKRCLDLVGALVGLTITAVLFPLIALGIKAGSPGPLFFGQVRMGESGRRFTCWKFRSMYLDAEERKQELLAHNEMSGAIFKIRNDPRVTPFGRFLRKTSLDELPQFWNVLRAEMSLVGTRPPTPDEVANYEDWHRRRICIRPGITGMWQVSGRNEITDFDEIVRLDLQYIDRWSIWLDIRILLKTVWVVFARKGSS